MSGDLFNGLFEFTGSVMIWMNVRKAYQDKQFKGISIGPTAFFTAWGLWNLWYYPSLNQWLSFIGGVNIVIANSIWLGQMFYYGRQAKRSTHNNLHGREMLANQSSAGGH